MQPGDDSVTERRLSTCRSRHQVAERGGFEPPVEFPPHMISSHAESAALASLRHCARGRCGRPLEPPLAHASESRSLAAGARRPNVTKLPDRLTGDNRELRADGGHLEALAVLAGEQLVGLACRPRTSRSCRRTSAARPTRYEMLARCGSDDERWPSRASQVSFARVAGADGVDEVLVVRALDAGQDVRVAAARLAAARRRRGPSRPCGRGRTATCGRRRRSRASPWCRRRGCRSSACPRRWCSRRAWRTRGPCRRRTRRAWSAGSASPATTASPK